MQLAAESRNTTRPGIWRIKPFMEKSMNISSSLQATLPPAILYSATSTDREKIYRYRKATIAEHHR